MDKQRSPNNRTITITDEERGFLEAQMVKPDYMQYSINNVLVNNEYENCIKYIDNKSISLLILDPPYNLSKSFNSSKFDKISIDEYTKYLDNIFQNFIPKLKDNATIYICGDWYSSVSIFEAASKYFTIKNRITWEREKGRGSKTNWKNCSEDIWFCVLNKDDYTFNPEKVKLRRSVIAPYKEDGKPKDWVETKEGKYRDTAPSNFMSDITIPFWSMPENTDHPTQKPEKLIAKLILASTNQGDLVCDPFCGSGTTAVVAQKLNRCYIAIEKDEEYCLWAQKRLNLVELSRKIQGYDDEVFWERNSSK